MTPLQELTLIRPGGQETELVEVGDQGGGIGSSSGDQGQKVEVELARLGEQIHALQNTFTDEKIASKEAIAAAFAAAKEAVAAALMAQKEAASKAEENQAKQLELHNGLIRKMEELTSTFLSKEEYTNRHDALQGEVGRLSAFQNRLAGGLIAVSFLGIANFVRIWTG